jgi:chromosome segregation ATPase
LTSQIGHVESQLHKEIQAKNQESFIRRELEEKLKLTEDTSRTALDYANKELSSLRHQLNDALGQHKKLEGELRQQVAVLTTEVYWNKQKVGEVADENRRLKGERDALIDTCRQLQKEHSSAMSSMEQCLMRSSIGSSSELAKSIDSIPLAAGDWRSAEHNIELEANLAKLKSELAQCRAKLQEMSITLNTKDSAIETLQQELDDKATTISEQAASATAGKQTKEALCRLEEVELELKAKDCQIASQREQMQSCMDTLTEFKLACEESSEKLSVTQEMNDELFDDLGLIKKFLKEVLEGSTAGNPQMNPTGRTSSQILAIAEGSPVAKGLLDKVVKTLDGQLLMCRQLIDQKTAKLMQVEAEHSRTLDLQRTLEEKLLISEAEINKLLESHRADRHAALRRAEELGQALASMTARCDSLVVKEQLHEQQISTLQMQRDEEMQSIGRQLSQIKNTPRRNSLQDTDFAKLKKQHDRLMEDRNTMHSELTRVTVLSRDLEVKLVDQTERQRRLEQAYEEIKAYAPEYIKEIISQATKAEFKYSTIEALIAQVDDLKNQLRATKTQESGIKLGYLGQERTQVTSTGTNQDTELQDWHLREEQMPERDRCACLVF